MSKDITLKQEFEEKILPELQKELGIKNKMAVPRVKMVKINVGIGSYLQSGGSKDPSSIVENVAQITGQKPVVTKAKKAISNFKLREGMPVGVVATLRGARMYDFLSKLVNVVLPRVRDFRGIPDKSFDGRGNYSLGLKEHLVFPEINPDDITKVHGIEITVVTTAKNNDDAYKLLVKLGFPFKKAKTN
ncbi:50S ribosomal protein L5 [Patescibacteria group bacterium]|nr:50S ribosomal protein L5 [Patescibacteria group bacterium]